MTADLMTPRRAVYWLDLGLVAAGTYGGLILAVEAEGLLRAVGAALCVCALYRGISFIHELTHLRPNAVPGFKLAWHLVIGIPFLVPSLLYEGVHNLHHAKQRYGTAADPEYLPLSKLPAAAIAAFAAAGLLAPAGAYLRFAIGTPLSLICPPLRRWLVARCSSMTINPGFRRVDLARAQTGAWRAQEIACWLWSWSATAMAIAAPPAARYVVTGFAALCLVAFANQLRTMVAHAWANDGLPMSFAAQFRDSINIPPPGWLPLIWAPVGLRFHALHHLLPRIPYHRLPEAHRRLTAHLTPSLDYGVVSHRGFVPAARALVGRSRRRARAA